MTTSPPAPIQRDHVSRKDLYEMIRKQIEHEDNLVNQRLQWLLLSQAFLISMFVALITRDKPINPPSLAPFLAEFIPFGLTLIGWLLNYFSFVGIRAAYQSLKRLRQWWYAPYPTEAAYQAVHGEFPPITWVGSKRAKSINTASATPILILLVWSFLGYAVMVNTHPTVAYIVAGISLLNIIRMAQLTYTD